MAHEQDFKANLASVIVGYCRSNLYFVNKLKVKGFVEITLDDGDEFWTDIDGNVCLDRLTESGPRNELQPWKPESQRKMQQQEQLHQQYMHVHQQHLQLHQQHMQLHQQYVQLHQQGTSRLRGLRALPPPIQYQVPQLQVPQGGARLQLPSPPTMSPQMLSPQIPKARRMTQVRMRNVPVGLGATTMASASSGGIPQALNYRAIVQEKASGWMKPIPKSSRNADRSCGAEVNDPHKSKNPKFYSQPSGVVTYGNEMVPIDEGEAIRDSAERMRDNQMQMSVPELEKNLQRQYTDEEDKLMKMRKAQRKADCSEPKKRSGEQQSDAKAPPKKGLKKVKNNESTEMPVLQKENNDQFTWSADPVKDHTKVKTGTTGKKLKSLASSAKKTSPKI